MTDHQDERVAAAHRRLMVLQQLRLELQRGTSALVADQLEDFRERIAALERLCSAWKLEMPFPLQLNRSGVGGLSEAMEIRSQLCEAHHQVDDLNRGLSAKLRHCQRTADLLSRHCRSFLGGTSGMPANLPGGSTWSTEA